MGSPFHKTIFLLTSMLIILVFGRTVEATPLEDVCRMTANVQFCLTDFGAGMQTAAILDLARLAIRDVTDNMGITVIVIESLLASGQSDPQIRHMLLECKGFYRPAFNSLVASAYYNLDHGLNHLLSQQAGAAFNAGAQCRSIYPNARFEANMYNLLRLSNILQVIADSFLGPREN